MTIISNRKVVSRPVLPEYAFRAFMSSPRGIRCRIMLGQEPARHLLQLVYASCALNLHSLSKHRNHLARELCGEEVWEPMWKRERCCAGFCLAFLATSHALPLRMHQTKSGKGSKRYWLEHQREAVPECSHIDQRRVLLPPGNSFVTPG